MHAHMCIAHTHMLSLSLSLSLSLTHTHTHTHTYIYILSWLLSFYCFNTVFIYVNVCVCVCLCVCVSVYINFKYSTVYFKKDKNWKMLHGQVDKMTLKTIEWSRDLRVYIGLVLFLWHINHFRLYNAESIF